MSEFTDTGGREQTDHGPDGVERIADPDNYTERRRLKQLYDARERVRSVKTNAVHRWRDNSYPNFSGYDRDLYVAEALVDYVLELDALIREAGQSSHDEFLQESVSIEGRPTPLTIADLVDAHGRPSDNGPRSDSDPIDYRTAIRFWRVCNEYFEEIAGPEFEDAGLPTDEFSAIPGPDDSPAEAD